MRQDTVDELLARDLPPAFADFLMGQDSKGTQARIQAFEEAYRAAVEAAVAAGKAEAEKRDLYITHKVIARQSEDIEWFARLNALGKDKLR